MQNPKNYKLIKPVAIIHVSSYMLTLVSVLAVSYAAFIFAPIVIGLNFITPLYYERYLKQNSSTESKIIVNTVRVLLILEMVIWTSLLIAAFLKLATGKTP